MTDLAKALNAMVERDDLLQGFEKDETPLEIAFMFVVYHAKLIIGK